MTAAEKAARKQARLDARGPVVGQIASADKPDVFYDVRFDGKAYWCPCIGFAIRKHCRHADYCEQGGFSVPMAVPANSVTPDRSVATRILRIVLDAGHVYVNEREHARMVVCLAEQLALYAPVQAAPLSTPSMNSGGFAMRRIVLED